MELESPAIESFVLRFYKDAEGSAEAAVRGVITHVQSGALVQFTNWPDAVDFIKKFVDFDDAIIETRR